MSWSLFKTRCSVLTGMQHVSRVQFSQTLAQAYHDTILLHFDTVTAGGIVTNTAPKYPMLYQGILSVCEANMMTHSDVHWIQQLAPHFTSYWAGVNILGPTGTVTIMSPGTWQGPKIVQNFNFQILLDIFILTARTHIMSLSGLYVSSVVAGVTAPWSGVTFVSLP